MWAVTKRDVPGVQTGHGPDQNESEAFAMADRDVTAPISPVRLISTDGTLRVEVTALGVSVRVEVPRILFPVPQIHAFPDGRIHPARLDA